MGRGGIDRRASDSDVLARLVSELGQAAREGWGPTTRWVVLLAVTAGALALLTAAWR
jgi:hypothetical protein